MAAPSAVKRLPPEVREPLEGWIKELIAGRSSLDEVTDRLATLLDFLGMPPEVAPSRSSIHRHKQSMEKVIERLQRSRELTKVMAEQLGPSVADGQGVQVMIQLVQGQVYELLSSAEEGTPADPKSIHDLAKAIHHIASAQKTDADRAMKIEAEVRKKAAADVQKLGKKLGWSADTARSVREEILGVKLTPPAAAEVVE